MTQIVNNNIKGRLNPIYIVIAEDPTTKTGFQHYLVEKKVNGDTLIDLQKCYEISETEYKKLVKKIEIKDENTKRINLEIPIVKIIKIQNITFNK